MKLSLFVRLCLVTVPAALMLETAYLDLGHDPSYFGHLSAGSAALIRYAAFALALASVICAAAFRSPRRKI